MLCSQGKIDFYFPGQIRWTGFGWQECYFKNCLDANMGLREKDNYLPAAMKGEGTPSIIHYQILGCHGHL